MDKVYGVCKSTYDKSPFVIVDSRADALKIAAAIKDYDDDKAAQLVVTLPFMSSKPQKVELTDLDRVVDMSIIATIKAYESVLGKGKDEEAGC